jgi:mannan endo-1,4-beta-mannosidase
MRAMKHGFLIAWCLGVCAAGWPARAFALDTANPNATPAAKALLNYLVGLPGKEDKRVLSGQVGGWSNHVDRDYEAFIVELHKRTGKWVAIAEFDYIGYTPSVNKRARQYWQEGGLLVINWHANNPWTGGSYQDRDVGSGLTECITPGTRAYESWIKLLDQTAERLKELGDAGAVVIWRPFHEMNSSGFWWCRRPKEDFIALWRHMFRYFTQTKKLDFLLWAYSPDDGYGDEKPGLYYYPGDEYVDIVGLDKYGLRDTVTLKHYEALVSTGKPFGVTEAGAPKGWDNTILIEAIRTKYPKTVFFIFWTGNNAIINHEKAGEMLSDPWVVNRDDLPASVTVFREKQSR